MGRQIKDDVIFGKYERKLNPDMRCCDEVRKRKSKIL